MQSVEDMVDPQRTSQRRSRQVDAQDNDGDDISNCVADVSQQALTYSFISWESTVAIGTRSHGWRKNPKCRPNVNILTCNEVNKCQPQTVNRCTPCVLFANEQQFNKKLRDAADPFAKTIAIRYRCDTLWERKAIVPESSSPPEPKRLKVDDEHTSVIHSIDPSATINVTPKTSGTPDLLPDGCISSPRRIVKLPETCKTLPNHCSTPPNDCRIPHEGSSTTVNPQKHVKSSPVMSDSTSAILSQPLKVKQVPLSYEMLVTRHLKLEQVHCQTVVELKYQESLVDHLRIELKSADLNSEKLTAELVEAQADLLKCQEQHKCEFQSLRQKHISATARQRSDVLKGQSRLRKEQDALINRMTSDHQNSIRVLRECLTEKHEVEVQSLRSHLESTHLPIPNSIDELPETLEKMVDSLYEGTSRVRRSTKAKTLVNAVWNKVYDGTCKKAMCNVTLSTIREGNPYRKAEEVLKVMDLSGAKLGIGALNTLQQGIEGVGSRGGKIWYKNCWIATQHFVKQAQSTIETAVDVEIPFTMSEEDGIDGIMFELEKLLIYVLKLYKLYDIACNPDLPPVQLAITLDGSDISRNRSFVAAGIKMLDPRAVDPETGIPLGLIGARKLQSRENCIPFQLIMSRDTKSLYDEHFSEFFNFFKEVEEVGFENIAAGRLLISSPQDMSSFWKSLKRGGGCKSKKYFCHCCACESENAYQPNKVRCAKCVEKGRTECYHHEVGDAETLARVRSDWEEMTQQYPYLASEDLRQDMRTTLNPDAANKENDINNIDYIPNTDTKHIEFSQDYVNHDLELLKLPIRGSFKDRRERLQTAHEHFYEADKMKAELNCAIDVGAHILIEQAVPCILHCENRCGEKILKLLLMEGLRNCDGEKRAEDAFMKQFEVVVNRSILGKPWRHANWRLKTTQGTDNKKAIADQTMPNPHVRKLLENFDKIVVLCVPEGERRREWNRAVVAWQRIIETARIKEDFSDDEIESFQEECDEFYELWMALHGRDGCTNYFHMIGSGHMSYYIRKWRNLYRYSQQGWEALNSSIKWFYFKRSQRGGNGGKKGEKNSKLKPIGRWMQRRLFFLSGDYKQLFD